MLIHSFLDFLSQPFGAFGSLCIMTAITVINSQRLTSRLASTGAPVGLIFNVVSLLGAISLLINAVVRDEIVWVILEVYVGAVAIKGIRQAIEGEEPTPTDGLDNPPPPVPPPGLTSPTVPTAPVGPLPLHPPTTTALRLGRGRQRALVVVPGLSLDANGAWASAAYSSLRRGFEHLVETDPNLRVHLIEHGDAATQVVPSVKTLCERIDAELAALRRTGIDEVVLVGFSLGAHGVFTYLNNIDRRPSLSWLAINPVSAADMLCGMLGLATPGEDGRQPDPLHAVASWWASKDRGHGLDAVVDLSLGADIVLPVSASTIASYLPGPLGVQGCTIDPIGDLLDAMVRLEAGSLGLTACPGWTYGFPRSPGRVILARRDRLVDPIYRRLGVDADTIGSALDAIGIPNVVINSDHNLSDLAPDAVAGLVRRSTSVPQLV